MQGLRDKVIVFAGAGGIATATATFLGAGGARLVVGDVVEASAQRTVDAAREAGGDGVATTLEIADEAQVARLIELATSTYGRIDGLFNVAANIEPDQVAADTDVVDIDPAVWQRMLDVNLTGYMLTCKYAIPHMAAAGGGAIVNTISDAVYAGMPDKVAYQATKAGVSAMTRHIASRFGKQGIRANSVAPGMVLTEKTRMNLSQELQDQVLATTPAARHGEPQDIGATVAFLLSDLAEWVTGQALCVDGGVVMRA